jgi:transposase
MAALSGEKTLAELSAEFGVHPTMISGWKQELVKRAGELFARGNKAPAVADAQKVMTRLHAAPSTTPACSASKTAHAQ